MDREACKIQGIAEDGSALGTSKVDMRTAHVCLPPTVMSEMLSCPQVSVAGFPCFPQNSVCVLSDLIPYDGLDHLVWCGGESLVGSSCSLQSCSPARRLNGSWCAASPLARGCLRWHITLLGQHFCNFAFELLQDSWVNTIWSQ